MAKISTEAPTLRMVGSRLLKRGFYRLALGLTTLLFITTAIPLLVGCGNSHEEAQPNATLPVSATTTPTVSPQATPALPYVVSVLLDVTSSYSRVYLNQGIEKMTSWLVEAVRPCQGKAKVYVQLIGADSFRDENTVMVSSFSGLPCDLLSPTPLPTFTPRPTATPLPTPNPFDSRAKATATAAIATATAFAKEQATSDQTAYAAAEATVVANIQKKATEQALQRQQAVATATQWAATISDLKLPVDNRATDVGGAIVRAARRSQGESGSKLLFIISDMKPEGHQSPIPQGSLAGFVVKVIYWQCSDASEICKKRETDWKQQLLRAGATSVDFYDPAQSTLLKNPLFDK